VFESSLTGVRGTTYDVTSFTHEPAGIDIDIDVAPDGHFWISDDGQQRVFDINLGPDGKFRTGDDSLRTISVAFDSDPEGLTLAKISGETQLFLVDGKGKKIWRCRFGPNGVFNGGGDDIITSFDVLSLGISDPEGIDYDANRGTLWVIDHSGKTLNEVSISGALRQSFDLVGLAGAFTPADVTIAPGSQSGTSLYIVDRGVDNNDDPNENDGKIYEIQLSAGNSSNLLGNPGFEADVNGDNKPDVWSTNTKFTRSNTLAHSGSFAGKFFATNDSGVTIKQLVPNLSAGTAYNVSGWLNAPSTSDAFTFKIKVEWLNSSGGTIKTVTTATFSDDTGGSWTQTVKSLTAPAGTTSAYVIMNPASLNGTIYVDDFELK